ncbi:MAG: hypothetical protein LBI99_04735 [Propionibacteriaceae bacterium]|jgi:hypothetical protein|nr:hypothetical protein [Propionibacteriaceae bacterium]
MRRGLLGSCAALAALAWLLIGGFAVPAQADSATPTPNQSTYATQPSSPAATPDPSASADTDVVDDEDIADLPDVPVNDSSTLIVLLAAGGVALVAALVVLIRK